MTISDHIAIFHTQYGDKKTATVANINDEKMTMEFATIPSTYVNYSIPYEKGLWNLIYVING